MLIGYFDDNSASFVILRLPKSSNSVHLSFDVEMLKDMFHISKIRFVFFLACLVFRLRNSAYANCNVVILFPDVEDFWCCIALCFRSFGWNGFFDFSFSFSILLAFVNDISDVSELLDVFVLAFCYRHPVDFDFLLELIETGQHFAAFAGDNHVAEQLVAVNWLNIHFKLVGRLGLFPSDRKWVFQ